MPRTVPPEELQAANGLLATSVNVSTIAGAALAGLLVAATGPGWAIGVDALSFLVAAGALAALRLTSDRRPPRRTGMVHELRLGWQEFSRRSWIWVVVAQFALVNAASSGAVNVLGPLVARAHDHGAAGWGLVLSLRGAGAIAGTLLCLRRRWHRPVLVAEIGALLLALPAALLAIPAPLILVGAAAVAAGLGSGVFGVLWESSLQRHVPRDVLARVSAYDIIGSVAAVPVGLALAGPLADAFGLRPTLLGAAALSVGATLLAIASRAVRQDDTGLGRPPGALTPNPYAP